jgi:hypothetical protein
MSAFAENNQSMSYPPSDRRQKTFVICESCYWCASALSTRQFDIDECPICKNPVSSLPLENNEIYKYNFTHSRGVELEFSSKK